MLRFLLRFVCLPLAFVCGLPAAVGAQPAPRVFLVTDGVPVNSETKGYWKTSLTGNGYDVLPEAEVNAARAFLPHSGAEAIERLLESLAASHGIWISIKANSTGFAVRVVLDASDRDIARRFTTTDAASLEPKVWELVEDLLSLDQPVAAALPTHQPVALNQSVTTANPPVPVTDIPRDYHRMALMGTVGSDGIGPGFNLRVNHGVASKVLLGVDLGLNSVNDGAIIVPVMATAEYRLRPTPKLEFRPRVGLGTHLLGTEDSLDLLIRGVIGVTWVYAISPSTSLVAGSDLMLDADQDGTFFIVNAGVNF